MADGLNRVILIGNLGADPELKYTQSNNAVLKMRIATQESYATRDGRREKRTEWHTVVVWGKRAEGLNKFLEKGRTVCVEGRLQYRSWDDKDGNRRYATEIVATEVLPLSGGQRSRSSGGERRERDEHDDGGEHREPVRGDEHYDYGDDDIPF